jgi:hypothetical protein
MPNPTVERTTNAVPNPRVKGTKVTAPTPRVEGTTAVVPAPRVDTTIQVPLLREMIATRKPMPESRNQTNPKKLLLERAKVRDLSGKRYLNEPESTETLNELTQL